MTATIITLHRHPATMPKVSAETPPIAANGRLSRALANQAQSMAILSCSVAKRPFDPKALAAGFWRLSECLDELAGAAERLERKLRKAKKRARRGN